MLGLAPSWRAKAICRDSLPRDRTQRNYHGELAEFGQQVPRDEGVQSRTNRGCHNTTGMGNDQRIPSKSTTTQDLWLVPVPSASMKWLSRQGGGPRVGEFRFVWAHSSRLGIVCTVSAMQ